MLILQNVPLLEGVLAAVHVARAGFPVRMHHGEFVKRYGLLAVNILQEAWAEAKAEHPEMIRDQERAVARCVPQADSSTLFTSTLLLCLFCVDVFRFLLSSFSQLW